MVETVLGPVLFSIAFRCFPYVVSHRCPLGWPHALKSAL